MRNDIGAYGKIIVLIACLFMLFAAFVISMTSCGSSDSGKSYYPPNDPEWEQKVSPVVQRDCGPCHDGKNQPKFVSGQQFKLSAARAKIEAGQMPPPPKTVSDQDRAILLGYLKGA